MSNDKLTFDYNDKDSSSYDLRGNNKVLVVVDDTPECRKAVRYASRRAQGSGGSLLLLRVVDSRTELAHWITVEERMKEEAFANAEELLENIGSEINNLAGILPAVAIRSGKLQDEILSQIKADPAISVLVLAAAPGTEGPGPLVTALAGTLSGEMRIPVTVVPGNLSDEEIDQLA